MKKLPLLILFTFSVQSLFAQLESYDLSKYVQGDVKEVVSYMVPYVQFRSLAADNNGNPRDFSEGSFSLSHYHSTFTNRLNSYGTFGIYSSFSMAGDKSDNVKDLLVRPIVSIDYQKNHYFYKKQFIGIDLNSNNSFRYFKFFGADNADPYHTTQYDTDTRIDFSIGTGRKQNIIDPLRAIAFYRILKDNNFLLKEDVDHSEIEMLSTLLNELRSLRNQDVSYTDSRLLRNARFELLCAFLIDHSMVREDDYTMFGLLYDTWRFEYFSPRWTNNELKFGLSIDYQYTREINDKTELDQKTITRSPSIYLSYQVNKPLNINWYITGDSRINYSKLFTQTPNNNGPINESNSNGFSASTEWRLNYQPNIRTNFYAGIDIEGRKKKDQNDPSSDEFENVYYIDYSLSMRYYFSPQYVMTFNLGLNKYYQAQPEDTYSSIYSYMNLSVNYYFR